jgi:formamidopyrimidine-DNA glycosylase
MPELPEVEVVKRSLGKKIQNLIIKKVKINDDKLRFRVNKKKFLKLEGLRLKRIERRSKYLIFFLDNDYLMLAHLGMTGKFFFTNKKDNTYKTSFYYNIAKKKDRKYDRIIFYLEKKQKMIYNDVRKFGFIKIIKVEDFKNCIHLKYLGPEPLKKNYNFEYFKKYIKGKKRSVKNLLMDQKFVSGLGNIYVNEVLYLSGVKPMRKVKNLKNTEIKKIILFTKKILSDAIKFGGSSIKDFSTIYGKKGTFQQHFRVYGKKGEKCSNTDCNQSIIKINISNRGTFYCSRCQK